MNQQEPLENNPLTTPGSSIQQRVENSTLGGGMQAIQGDKNIQLQNSTLVLQQVRAEGNITVENITQIYETVNNLGDIPKPTGFPQNIPDSSTDKFVGRERELESLHQKLQRNHEVVIAAIEGMGGVGKTELAIQYCLLHLQLHSYPGGICWLRARESDIGLQILQFAITDLGLQPPENLKLPERVRWCWQRWQQGNTLVVLDDVNNYSHIKPYLPPQPSQFKILITTRLKLDLASSLFLEVLSETEALLLLAQLIGEEKQNQELAQAKELCLRLGYLPLALQLVGRYVKKRKISLAEMLRCLEEKGLGHPSLIVKENDPTWTLNVKRGVATAFELSWSELNDDAQQLGCLLSLFALDPIPWSLVKRAAVKQDQQELEDARFELENLHLLQGKETYELHQLIREFLRNKQNNLAVADEQKYNLCQVVVEVAKKISKKISDTSTEQEISEFTLDIPHIAEAATVYENWLLPEDLIAPFMGLARFYKSQIDYDKAKSWCERCLNTTKNYFEQDHPDVATSLHNLAYFYESQGCHAKAESFLLEALKIRKCKLGENHPDVATSLNNLASTYCSQGRYAEAQSLLLEALKIRKCELGENHPDVAQSLNNLALVYVSQGPEWYYEGERLYKEALELIKQLQDEKHPHMAISLNNLALLYHSQKRYSEAEDLFRKSLELLKEVLSNEHPDIALSSNNLALLYCSQKRYPEAKLLYQQSIKIQRNKLGNKHPHLATSLNNLAECYRLQKCYSEAESCHEEALNIRKQSLGDDHPDVATSLNNLALVYFDQQLYTKAKSYLSEALEIRQSKLSKNHPDVVASLNNLAEFEYFQNFF
jgi:tetratricopeptide (TPR) repeat protein